MLRVRKLTHGAWVVSYDNGPCYVFDASRRGGGRYTVVPFVRNILKRDVCDVIVSHMHDDHVGGIPEVIEMMPRIGKVYTPGEYSTGAGLGRDRDLSAQNRLQSALSKR